MFLKVFKSVLVLMIIGRTAVINKKVRSYLFECRGDTWLNVSQQCRGEYIINLRTQKCPLPGLPSRCGHQKHRKSSLKKLSFWRYCLFLLQNSTVSEFHRLAVKRRGSNEGKDSNGGLGRDDWGEGMGPTRTV